MLGALGSVCVCALFHSFCSLEHAIRVSFAHPLCWSQKQRVFTVFGWVFTAKLAKASTLCLTSGAALAMQEWTLQNQLKGRLNPVDPLTFMC